MDAPQVPPDDSARKTGLGRSTHAAPAPKQFLSDEERARLEARNGLLQFDEMVGLIRAGIQSNGPYRLRPSDILRLHYVATLGLQDDAGRFRLDPVHIDGTKHEPPHSQDVPRLVEDLCDEVSARWSSSTPVHLAAYVMWRLNWIHPFSDGNGRTTRAVSYLVLCVRLGFLLPGGKTIPQQIASNKFPYYDALDLADKALKDGCEDVSAMEALLGDHLAAQLLRVHRDATGVDPDAVVCDADDGSGQGESPEGLPKSG